MSERMTERISNISDYFPSNISLSAAMPSMPSISISVPSMPSMPSFPMPSMPSMPSIPSLVSSAMGVVCVQSAPQRKTWSQLRDAVRNAHRRLFEVSSKVPFSINFRTLEDECEKAVGTRIYFLSALNSSPETTILYCDVLFDKANSSNEYSVASGIVSSTPPTAPTTAATTTDSFTCNISNGTIQSTQFQIPSSQQHKNQSFTVFEWKPLIECRYKKFRENDNIESFKIDHQEKLQLERKRIMFTGITAYEFDFKSGRFVFSSFGDLFYFDDKGTPPYVPILLESSLRAAKLNPQICSANPDLIAFVCDNDIWVLNVKSGHEIRLTNTKFNNIGRVLSAGLPSYVIQEEFRRYQGFWWRPESEYHHLNTISENEESNSFVLQYDILYEEVDETDVELIKIPSWEGNVEEYRFPRPGNPNAISSLKLATFKLDMKTQQMSEPLVLTIPVLPSLYDLYPDYEYLVRVGWHSYDSFWVQLLNRKQKNLVLGLISLSNSFPPQILYTEDSSPLWINVSDVLHFMNQPTDAHRENLRPGSEVSFIWLSEKTGFRHIYQIKAQIVGIKSEEKEKMEILRRSSGGPNSTDDSIETVMKDEFPNCLKSILLSKKQITCGNWEVYDGEVWVDERNNLVYFVGLKESPLERHLFVMSLTEELNQGIKRLTDPGYSHTTVAFDSNFSVFINIQSNISIPPYGYIHRIIPPSAKSIPYHSSPKRRNSNSKSDAHRHSLIPTFEKLGLYVTNLLHNHIPFKPETPFARTFPGTCNPINVDQIDLLPGLSKPELFTYQLKSSGDVIYGLIFKPEFMESGVKYPCVVDVYGGPEIQIVTNSFKGVRHVRRHLLSSEGYVVCAFDCRGSHHRGTQFEAHIQNRMGQVEVADQVEVLQWLAENTGYIDMSRIAIHGWSYGGYLSLMCFGQRPDIFKVCIAGAPVTNWCLYDTGYTERYMGTPYTNPEGYAKGSVLHYINQFPNDECRLLIIHGLMDENVHFFHTAELIQALVKAGKPYNLQVC
ncbi:Dipeptidyl peptidase 9-like protein [Dinothrombium tinctorium]|uniref:Dipeptidyl peptidase 9-like protein n=1 Tax=Dinothrombium tinctorium TaxID=1965070 RepID=A0A3S3P8Z2_9ACAR|nr:Dipeptidyl peptidase 9-like protein [Dinothrombium tinctorium]RWS14797.1 Dipeptidyl peptidase 9-like protein [Dinothrombium tinctorium]RWS14800.1 Dipeptidyl peptidase 9-like protein [Dinothrombium tinctorium]